MTQLSRGQLEALLDASADPSISLYLPTERKGAETQQNPIRFKNLVRNVEKQLAEKGLEKPEVAEMLEPLRRMVDDHEFWQHQEDGLAVFRSADLFETYPLPVRFSETAMVSDHFYLKPLFTLFRGDGRFHILALSLHNVRLLAATRYSVREIELGDEVPRSLVEAVGEEIEEKHIQYHTGSKVTQGGGSPVYHGQGGGEKEDQKQEISQFLHRLDNALKKLLGDRGTPLVLAGVDYLRAIYRETSDHPNLLEEGISGNPEKLRPEELHEKAWNVVRPLLIARREKDAARYSEMAAAGKGSSALEEVIPAAFDGRIETLFVARGQRRWGSFDTQTRELRLFEEPRNGSDDLLDLAAVRTFMNGGTVYALEGDQLPEGAQPVAAIFRY